MRENFSQELISKKIKLKYTKIGIYFHLSAFNLKLQQRPNSCNAENMNHLSNWHNFSLVLW